MNIQPELPSDLPEGVQRLIRGNMEVSKDFHGRYPDVNFCVKIARKALEEWGARYPDSAFEHVDLCLGRALCIPHGGGPMFFMDKHDAEEKSTRDLKNKDERHKKGMHSEG